MAHKVAVIFGFGPGVGRAVATKFGKEGYVLALVARSADKLDAGVADFKAAGIAASAFPADMGKPSEVGPTFGKIKAALGNVSIVVWNGPTGTAKPFDQLTLDDINAGYQNAAALFAGLQAAVPALEVTKGAFLFTGGALGTFLGFIQDLSLLWGAQLLGSVKIAQRHLIFTTHKLASAKGVFVGDINIMGTVKGTSYDDGTAKLEGSTIADAFWTMATERPADKWTVDIY